jgi:hypothetical protein
MGRKKQTRLERIGIGELIPGPRIETAHKHRRPQMKRALLVPAVLCLAATGALAADNSSKADSAIATFQSVAKDAGKLKIYCEMSDIMDKAGDNPDEATETKIDDFVKQLGPDFQTAWDAGDDMDEDSPDGKKLDAALDDLSSKCQG